MANLGKQPNQHEVNRQIEALIMREDAAGEGYTPEEVALIRRYSGAPNIAISK